MPSCRTAEIYGSELGGIAVEFNPPLCGMPCVTVPSAEEVGDMIRLAKARSYGIRIVDPPPCSFCKPLGDDEACYLSDIIGEPRKRTS